jgi:spore coat protein U-like protein
MKGMTRQRIIYNLTLGLGLLACGGGTATPVLAGSATANLTVTVQVIAQCIMTVSTLQFGDNDASAPQRSSSLDASGVMRGSCRSGTIAIISLDQGAYAAPGSTAMAPLRRMRNARGDFLSYQLYQDGALSTVWGGSTSARIVHAGGSSATDVLMYGRVVAGQNAISRGYHDTVVATITY